MKTLLGALIVILFWGCAPKISTEIISVQPTLNDKIKVLVIEFDEAVPKGSIEIGKVKIFDTGFSVNCK